MFKEFDELGGRGDGVLPSLPAMPMTPGALTCRTWTTTYRSAALYPASAAADMPPGAEAKRGFADWAPGVGAVAVGAEADQPHDRHRGANEGPETPKKGDDNPPRDKGADAIQGVPSASAGGNGPNDPPGSNRELPMPDDDPKGEGGDGENDNVRSVRLDNLPPPADPEQRRLRDDAILRGPLEIDGRVYGKDIGVRMTDGRYVASRDHSDPVDSAKQLPAILSGHEGPPAIGAGPSGAPDVVDGEVLDSTAEVPDVAEVRAPAMRSPGELIIMEATEAKLAYSLRPGANPELADQIYETLAVIDAHVKPGDPQSACHWAKSTERNMRALIEAIRDGSPEQLIENLVSAVDLARNERRAATKAGDTPPPVNGISEATLRGILHLMRNGEWREPALSVGQPEIPRSPEIPPTVEQHILRLAKRVYGHFTRDNPGLPDSATPWRMLYSSDIARMLLNRSQAFLKAHNIRTSMAGGSLAGDNDAHAYILTGNDTVVDPTWQRFVPADVRARYPSLPLVLIVRRNELARVLSAFGVPKSKQKLWGIGENA